MGATCSSLPIPVDPSCECKLEDTAPLRTRLKVGSASGYMDAPIQMALAFGNCQSLAVNLNWVKCPLDAGAVMAMMSGGLLDMAIMHTEDALAFAALGSPLRICGTFVSTPRVFGAYVPYTAKATSSHRYDDQDGLDDGGIVGVHDEHGAMLLNGLLADNPDWAASAKGAVHLPKRGYRPCQNGAPRRVFSSMRKVADALEREAISSVLWESRAAHQMVDSGAWSRLFEVPLPWPSFLFVASREACLNKAGAVRHFIEHTKWLCGEFKANRGNTSLHFMQARYGFPPEEASEWINTTKWLCECEVDMEALRYCLQRLRCEGIIPFDRSVDPYRYLAKEICSIDVDSASDLPDPWPRSPSPKVSMPPEMELECEEEWSPEDLPTMPRVIGERFCRNGAGLLGLSPISEGPTPRRLYTEDLPFEDEDGLMIEDAELERYDPTAVASPVRAG